MEEDAISPHIDQVSNIVFRVILNEGLLTIVPQSTNCPSVSRALRSQTWLRKVDARSCVELLDRWKIDATSYVDYAKPYLPS